MTRLHDNIILLTDSYKLSHYKQYPPNTTNVYSYLEARKGAKFPKTVFFGLQYFLKRYLQGQVVTRDKIAQAQEIARVHMGNNPNAFNLQGWQYILDRHNGFLPLRIKAVREGSIVDVDNVLMTVENTDPNCYWLTNYVETLLVQIWYPITVATTSYYAKQKILHGLEISGDLNLVDFKLHDFGFRGVSSVESAGIGGLAHLVNFKGTDTIAALGCGIEYYDSGVCGFSIPASEHSTITSWGKDHEENAFSNMLEQYPDGLVACVSDSFDLEAACKILWGKNLKDKVLSRNGTLVVRPDSGEIVSTVLNTLNWLAESFGVRYNNKGYKVLNNKIRVIQGDGCTIETIEKVIAAMIQNKWSIDNIAFGMGGGLLQKIDRDTQRFAFKCSSVVVDNIERDVYKAPKTDMSKESKRGRLGLIKINNKYMTVSEHENSQLNLVFENGELIINDTLDDIRNLVNNNG